MPLLLRTLLVMAVTAVAVLGSGRVLDRLPGLRQAQGNLAGFLVRMLVRLFLGVGICLAVALSEAEDKAVLVFAVGATYFAVVLATAWRESRPSFTKEGGRGRMAEGSR